MSRGYQPRHAAQPRREQRLMTWRAPRLPKTAHVMLAVALAVGIYIAGGVVLDRLIVDTAMWLFVMLCWGVMVAGSAQAYVEGVIRR